MQTCGAPQLRGPRARPRACSSAAAPHPSRAGAPWPTAPGSCRAATAAPSRRWTVARAAPGRNGGGDDDAAGGGAFGDKWENLLSVHHTLSSLYTPKVTLEPFKQIDHAAKRRERELREICEAGRKLGVSDEAVRANAASLESLVPGLAPNLDKMKASDWAKLLKDTSRVVATVIALRGALPSADLGAMISRQPRLLLREPGALTEDVRQVKALLSRCPNVDAILQEVPDLISPRELEQALANLRRCFPKEDAMALLQANPSILRNIGGEVDLEADPSYGEMTTAG
ncbi:hypothetical protein MNEG_1493 [Monoraphidium neglectum]|uniref:Uncharacterized protein n=1 Tax=Monoraphidium neglectum TaxID=145388 RepID=A0A0D2LJ29_9CHLO|nr:hypothetical protein MNEG_1493 [Monoraphidium neglectum]KIZ06459.1 hypothetical protein MNEG_1493 [Monoraphidium neglectum]|eukprot:XP_013905478.1 hypothetical protein MNEG_1493 [Monoraphidium neglectum]